MAYPKNSKKFGEFGAKFAWEKVTLSKYLF